ncbi:MAG: aconitate hydratase [Candidatus Aureabacteria bacterium]|nr:aconitate hydratase [Candidatus Auribacterota bacterium]
MGKSVTEKIIARHLVGGGAAPGGGIALCIDQTLTQDATGTLAFLQFEALGRDRTHAGLSVSYVDHNTLQAVPENADDHRYLETTAARYGVYFSRPGNGICHQVHLERFAVPGATLLGSDSHTPTSGGLGMLAIGAGGLDVAAAMAGEPFYLAMPEVVLVRLAGRLRPWVSAKDIILEVLRRFGVGWGRGKILEYGGQGLAWLSVPERATIANMGTELGATSSVFPSDARAREFLSAQRRVRDWRPLLPERDAGYAHVVDIDVGKLEPLIALPHSPDNVRRVSEMKGIRVDQVCIGSCTNSSLRDMLEAAAMLKGRTIAPHVSFTVSPGSKQIFRMMARCGALDLMIAAGARMLENACGPCIGMGQAPPSGGVSLRTFNRNFKGRSGTPDAEIYLASTAAAVASALAGEITDPRKLGAPVKVRVPERYLIDDRMIVPPPKKRAAVRIVKGPNIKPLPRFGKLSDRIEGELLLVCGDNVSTDDIMPAGAKFLPLRSNIPALAEHVFERIDPSFARRAREAGSGFIVAGDNYGQGSSREHAALAPRFLGVRAVIARSFARIHHANLVNFGIAPLTLVSGDDLRHFLRGDLLRVEGLRAAVSSGGEVRIRTARRRAEIRARVSLNERSRKILLAGGLLNFIKERG